MEQPNSGIALARSYWLEVLRALLDDAVPQCPRAVARIGTGSDVLGLDDEMSRDHDWGLRLQVFVPDESRADITELLLSRLPASHLGHPTRLTFTGQSVPALTVDVTSVDHLVSDVLGFDPRLDPTATDWLSLTGQVVLEVTSGAVFEDTAGELSSLRKALSWYPEDLWRYVVACDWQRIDQELPLMQRAGHRGDDLGSRVIAARLVDTAMHLGFLLSRQWAPYAKWRGTLFSRLPLPSDVGSHLTAVLTADDWQARVQQLTAALELLAGQQQKVGLPTAPAACAPFWDRPFVQVHPELVPTLLDSIGDPEVRRLPRGTGSIEQFSDNVDLLVDTSARRRVVNSLVQR